MCRVIISLKDGGGEGKLNREDVQARGFPGKIKAYESKQAISVRRPEQGAGSKGQDTSRERGRNWQEKQTRRNVHLL